MPEIFFALPTSELESFLTSSNHSLLEIALAVVTTSVDGAEVNVPLYCESQKFLGDCIVIELMASADDNVSFAIDLSNRKAVELNLNEPTASIIRKHAFLTDDAPKTMTTTVTLSLSFDVNPFISNPRVREHLVSNAMSSSVDGIREMMTELSHPFGIYGKLTNIVTTNTGFEDNHSNALLVDTWRTADDGDEEFPVEVPGEIVKEGRAAIVGHLDELMNHWEQSGFRNCGYTNNF